MAFEKLHMPKAACAYAQAGLSMFSLQSQNHYLAQNSDLLWPVISTSFGETLGLGTGLNWQTLL